MGADHGMVLAGPAADRWVSHGDVDLLGVTRVSLAGSLARASLSLLELAGGELLDSGTLGFLDGAIGYADLQRRFGS